MLLNTNSTTVTLEESKWHSIENGKLQDDELRDLLPLSEDIYVWFSEANTEEIHEFQTPIKKEEILIICFAINVVKN